LNYGVLTKTTAWQLDPTNHKILFVDVDKHVRLEVLDWGGSLIHELLESDLPALERDLRAEQKKLEGTAAVSAQPVSEPMTVGFALQDGMQKYTTIPVPVLAIYAIPHNRGITDLAARAAADAEDMELSGVPAKAFESGVPSSRVVLLPHANHFIFISNESDVLREMFAFIGNLP
jgi:hypothetical protein